ncbi:unnamed protein product [Trifolium pratense]|uniref:Uncharacterized protein n=1 Tax=Trifolium pratense TaxID=57577 RepID=A0ACB0LJ87_TRIPR|nr:unnamed protein product [Trifolium pratense]
MLVCWILGFQFAYLKTFVTRRKSESGGAVRCGAVSGGAAEDRTTRRGRAIESSERELEGGGFEGEIEKVVPYFSVFVVTLV